MKMGRMGVHMYRSMIGSLMYLTSSRPDIMFVVCACARYQVNLKVSHLHAMKRIFRYLKGQPKLGLWYPKDSPFDLVAYTDSDYAGASLDRKSTTGGCQFLGCRLISWQCKKQTVVANSTTEAEYVAASSCCGQVLWIQNQLLDYGPKTTAWNEFSSTMASAIICLATNHKFNFSKFIFEGMIRNLDNVSGKFLMYPRFVQVFLDQQLEERPTHKRIYNAPSHTKKIFGNIRRVGKGFSGRVTPLFPTMVVQNQLELGKGSANPTDPHHIPTITQSSTQPQKTQKPKKPKRKNTQVPQPSDPSENVADEAVHKELGDSLVRAATAASSLEVEQDSGNITKTRSKATPNESSSLGPTSGGGPKCQETIRDTIAQTRFENVSKHSNDSLLTRVKTTQQNEIDSLKRRVKKLEKKRSSRTHKMKRLNKVGLTARVESSSDEESLGEDASKQGRKINAIDADEDITLEVFVAAQNENVVEEVVDAAQEEPPLNPMEKKLKSMLDEEVALKLQAEFDEEERLAREKSKGFDSIQEMFDRAFKRVNILEDFRTELVKGKEKRAGEELIQEGLKKQKVDDDKETIKLKQCLKIIPDKEEGRIIRIKSLLDAVRITAAQVYVNTALMNTGGTKVNAAGLQLLEDLLLPRG
ncbi:hypothetical protein Tco_0194217 [Tanacetum coccineum]